MPACKPLKIMQTCLFFFLFFFFGGGGGFNLPREYDCSFQCGAPVLGLSTLMFLCLLTWFTENSVCFVSFPRSAFFILCSCTTTELFKLQISCLTTIKNHVIIYCEKVYERSGKNLFWSIKHSCEVINKLKSRGFRASRLSTYDFTTLYTTLPHNIIKDKIVDLTERIFQREGTLYIACIDRHALFT